MAAANLQDMIGVEGGTEGCMGALVSWDTQDTQVSTFEALCRAAGVQAPAAPSDEVCVRRALDALVAVVEGRGGDKAKRKRARKDAVTRYLVRPLRQRGAYALVAEHLEGKKITGYETVVDRAYVEHGVLKSEVVGFGHLPRCWPLSVHDTVVRLREAFYAAHSEFPRLDVGAHFTAVVKHYAGIAYREAGGVYFVTADGLAAFRRIKAQRSVQKVSIMPVVRCDDVVDAVLGALERTVDTQVAQSHARVREGVGERGRDTERSTLGALVQKLGHYEALLGRRLDSLREKISAADQALVIEGLVDLGDAMAGVA